MTSPEFTDLFGRLTISDLMLIAGAILGAGKMIGLQVSNALEVKQLVRDMRAVVASLNELRTSLGLPIHDMDDD